MNNDKIITSKHSGTLYKITDSTIASMAGFVEKDNAESDGSILKRIYSSGEELVATDGRILMLLKTDILPVGSYVILRKNRNKLILFCNNSNEYKYPDFKLITDNIEFKSEINVDKISNHFNLALCIIQNMNNANYGINIEKIQRIYLKGIKLCKIFFPLTDGDIIKILIQNYNEQIVEYYFLPTLMSASQNKL